MNNLNVVLFSIVAMIVILSNVDQSVFALFLNDKENFDGYGSIKNVPVMDADQGRERRNQNFHRFMNELRNDVQLSGRTR
uniref:Uncharacterized protein n=1 Tax=Romanomermis culicivorax TaxID=13658 RepID=A0A915IQV1_ROMCU